MGKRKVTASILYVEDPIYGYDLLVVLGGELQTAINIYARRIGEEPWKVESKRQYGNFAACRPYKNGVLWFKDTSPSLEIVSHECFHAIMYLFECLNMKGPTDDTEEVFAYYLEFLVKKVLSFI